MSHMVEILKVISWPAVVLLIALWALWLLRHALIRLIQGANSVVVKVKGVEIVISGNEAENLLQKLADDAFKGLTEPQTIWFDAIRKSDGAKTVDLIHQELFSTPFVRTEPPTEGHECLRELRDRQLIAPKEGSSWRAHKHPIITHFADMILRHKPDAIAPKGSPRASSPAFT
jgi:hypothetical protein